MNVTLHIPDDLARRFGCADEVARWALEAFAADEYRAGRLTSPELRLLLGFGTCSELGEFFKARGIFEEFSIADPQKDRQSLRQIGL